MNMFKKLILFIILLAQTNQVVLAGDISSFKEKPLKEFVVEKVRSNASNVAYASGTVFMGAASAATALLAAYLVIIIGAGKINQKDDEGYNEIYAIFGASALGAMALSYASYRLAHTCYEKAKKNVQKEKIIGVA